MPLQLSLDISVDISYGFVKALRIVRSCNPKNVVSDSERVYIHIDFEGDVKQFVECIKDIKGIVSADVKAMIMLSTSSESLRKLLRGTSYTVVPSALSARVLAYRRVDEKSFSLIEKTSRDNVVMLRILHVKNIIFPIPPSTYIIHGSAEEVFSKVINVVNMLIKEYELLKNTLGEKGVSAEL